MANKHRRPAQVGPVSHVNELTTIMTTAAAAAALHWAHIVLGKRADK